MAFIPPSLAQVNTLVAAIIHDATEAARTAAGDAAADAVKDAAFAKYRQQAQQRWGVTIEGP